MVVFCFDRRSVFSGFEETWPFHRDILFQHTEASSEAFTDVGTFTCSFLNFQRFISLTLLSLLYVLEVHVSDLY